MNEFTLKVYEKIRDRGHFTIIDDGSVQEWLSRKLLNQTVLIIGEKRK